MRDVRLGDDIDDFCIRCKRVMNHAVVSVVNAAAAKVRCRTCHSDHDFRNEQPPPPKIDPRKAAALAEALLKKAAPEDGVDELALEAVAGLDADVDIEAEAPEEVAAAEEIAIVEEAPAAKVKKGKAKK